MPGDAFGGLNYIAMCAAYSPNLDSPDGIDLPLDLFTSELRPDVWKRWLAHDPVRLVDSHHRALASMRLVYFDSGDHDEYYMQFGARILSRKLTGYGVRHQFEEFDGSHRQTGHRLERSFRLIGEAFRRAD